MIQDSLYKLLAILLSLVMLFLVPTVLSFQRQDAIAYNLVQVEVNRFSEMVRESGYVDQQMMTALNSTLNATGNNYKVEFEHLEKAFSSDGTSIKVYYDGSYTEDIIEEVNLHKKYRMSIGDFFYVTVENTSQTKSQLFNTFIGMRSGGPGIRVISGGVIRYGDT